MAKKRDRRKKSKTKARESEGLGLIPRRHSSNSRHVAEDYYNAGQIDTAWNLVRELKPRAQRQVLGANAKRKEAIV